MSQTGYNSSSCILFLLLSSKITAIINNSKLDHQWDAGSETGLPNAKNLIFFQPNLSFTSCSDLCHFIFYFFLATSISYLQHFTIVSELTPTGRTNGPLPLLVIPSPIVRTPTFGTQSAKKEKQDSASHSNERFCLQRFDQYCTWLTGFRVTWQSHCLVATE